LLPRNNPSLLWDLFGPRPVGANARLVQALAKSSLIGFGFTPIHAVADLNVLLLLLHVLLQSQIPPLVHALDGFMVYVEQCVNGGVAGTGNFAKELCGLQLQRALP